MPYHYDNHQTYHIEEDSGEMKLLANFVAQITKQTVYIDGKSENTFLTINGTKQIPNPDKPDEPTVIHLPEIVIPSEEFNSSMPWIQKRWGTDAYISPGYAVKDNLRAAIQLNSNPVKETVYKHTGWTGDGARRMYLHAAGGVGRNGPTKNVRVELPSELAGYQLPTDTAVKPQVAINATLRLLKLAKSEQIWPLLAATFCPMHGPVDFAIHMSGKTGTFKSEVASLFQSHFGSDMDARHLPGSWSSTPNAIEVQAYHAKNALFVLDDFLPGTTTWQAKAYQQAADRIIRAQGNQAGRARLSDTSNLQTTYYPRGMIYSTGEDIPEGHSVRARLFIVELSPGDVLPAELTKAQKNRNLFPYTTMYYAQHLANEEDLETRIADRTEEVRNNHHTLGHARTPTAFGRLIASIEHFLDWCGQYIKGAETLKEAAFASIQATAEEQAQHLETTDPTDILKNAIRVALNSGLAHMRTTDGGIPKGAELLGWTKMGGSDGDIAMYKSHGPGIGWVSWKSNEMFIDASIGINVIRKVAKQELQTTTQTLIKRLKEAGMLTRTDAARQRNTIRITAENHQRSVIAIRLKETLDITEIPT